MEIHVTWKGHHLADSPYSYRGRVYAESCDCPLDSIDEMINDYQCSVNVAQIDHDLNQFQNVDFNQVLTEAMKRFSHAGSYSFCHYVVLNNKVFLNSAFQKLTSLVHLFICTLYFIRFTAAVMVNMLDLTCSWTTYFYHYLVKQSFRTWNFW